MGDLAAAGRMADVDSILKVQGRDQIFDVGCISIHLIPAVGLVRTAVTAAVMGNHPEALAEEEDHLIIPVVRRQRPAMMKDDRMRVSGAPVLVEDPGAILGGDCAHATILPAGGCRSTGPALGFSNGSRCAKILLAPIKAST